MNSISGIPNVFGQTSSRSKQTVISTSGAFSGFRTDGGLKSTDGELSIKLDSDPLNDLSLSNLGLVSKARENCWTNNATNTVSSNAILGTTNNFDIFVVRNKINYIVLKDSEINVFRRINMNRSRVTNVFDPTNAQDCATKHYVDTRLPASLPNYFTSSGNVISVLKKFDMNGNKLSNLLEPVHNQDASTKKYVDSRLVLNNVGFIPNLITDGAGKGGFVSSSDSILNSEAGAFNVFNTDLSKEWSANGISSNCYVEIILPFAIKIWRFTLAGKSSNAESWRLWKIEASNEGSSTWVSLHTGIDRLGSAVRVYTLNSISEIGYKRYRFYGISGESPNPGLSHFQLYSADEIHSTPMTTILP